MALSSLADFSQCIVNSLSCQAELIKGHADSETVPI